MVMWYLLVTDRLRCFFSNPKDAELMRWCDSDKRKKGDGKLCHPADAHSGKNSMSTIIWNLERTRGMISLHWVWTEWIRLVKGLALTTLGRWSWRCTTCLHGCARRGHIFCCPFLYKDPKHPGINIDVDICRRHWIAFMIQPKKGRMLVLDSTDFAPTRYAESVSILNMLAK